MMDVPLAGEPPCARMSLSVTNEGGLMKKSKVVLEWSFELGMRDHTIALTASLKGREREILVDNESLVRGDGTAYRDDKLSRFSWKRHGHAFALEERLDLPKRTEAARRFTLSIDDTPFEVSDQGCVATLKGKRGSETKRDQMTVSGLYQQESMESESKGDDPADDAASLKVSHDRAAEALAVDVDSIGMRVLPDDSPKGSS